MDIIACILEITGAWMVGNRNKWGFVVFTAGNVFWLLTGVLSALNGLIIVSLVFAGINVRNFRKWSKQPHSTAANIM